MNNVCELIEEQFRLNPDKLSIVAPNQGSKSYKSYTFKELETRINKLANKLTELGVLPGEKVLIFIKPNLDFCAITFALFKLGAICVFIDPGMPKKMFLKCLTDLKPDVMIGLPQVHFLSWFFPNVFKSIKLFITTAPFGFIRSKSLYKNLSDQSSRFDVYSPLKDDLAAILFTSGGTGPAKGVEYTHDIFISQTKMLQKEFNLTKDETDIPGFPLFSFFTLAMGMTSVIPEINFAKPAKCDPKILYKNITDHQASFLAGSPAIWERLADYCLESKLTLPSVKFVTMFGAPVRNSLHQKFEKILPHGTTYTPYGATECLPVSNISGMKILKNFKTQTDLGAGICVGKPMDQVQVKIHNPDNHGIGEILVHSPNMTKKYYQNSTETEASKVLIDGVLWHKMGDVGYLKEDNLWFCGRTKHIVTVGDLKIYPVKIEGILNAYLNGKRSAVVQEGAHAAVFIEGTKDIELEEIIRENLDFFTYKNIYFKDQFPVDIRHNIKIDRIKLSQELMENK